MVKFQRSDSEDKKIRDLLWIFPAALPFLLIFLWYVFQPWSWGLMDDLTILKTGTGIVGKFSQYFHDLYQWGVLRPTFVAHSAVVYTVFDRAPGLLHMLKLAEIMFMLLIWSWLAWRLTQKRTSLFILPSIALSFHFLYDQFFFLSTHETLGLIFCGLAVNLCVSVLSRISLLESPGSFKKSQFFVPVLVIMGLFSILSAFGAKETFIATGVALGVAILITAFFVKGWHKSIALLGGGILVVALAYGVLLKSFICHGYSAGYNLTNIPFMAGNLMLWVKKDFSNHLPWIGAVFILVRLTGGRLRWSEFGPMGQFGLICAAMLYLSFLAILLPWSTTTYYAGPLGVFFAFLITIVLSPRLEKLGLGCLVVLVLCMSALNVFVSGYALNREATYHYDTQNLWQWIKGNENFQVADQNNNVFCNAMEASVAIPGHADRWWRLNLKSFAWTEGGVGPLQDKVRPYYVYSKRFGGLDDAQAKGWQTVFYSKYWQVYQKK